MAKQKPGGNGKKSGRSKRKAEGRNKPLSKYVRGIISAETYFKLSGQKIKG